METRKELVVKKEKTRLDKFLQEILSDFSRTELQSIIADGGVLVDGVVVRDKSKIVKKNQKVILTYSSRKLFLRSDIKLRKIYEDNDVVVVDKPPGIVVHPNPRMQKPSIAAAVLAEYSLIDGVGEDKFRPGIVHRLDADTSGVLIMAKSQMAYEHLKNAFQSRKVYKEYLALVHGKLKAQHGKIESAIGRIAGQGKLSAGIGRPAVTEYWVREECGEGVDRYSYLKVQLHTGRTHQIRVHFSSVGNPVAGDRLYGGKWKKKDAKFFPRQFLHAHKLRLILPSGEEKEFISPLSNDLRKMLTKLLENL